MALIPATRSRIERPPTRGRWWVPLAGTAVWGCIVLPTWFWSTFGMTVAIPDRPGPGNSLRHPSSSTSDSTSASKSPSTFTDSANAG